jgi:hypothetical protein
LQRRQNSWRKYQSSSHCGKTQEKTLPSNMLSSLSVRPELSLVSPHILTPTKGRCEELQSPTIALKVFSDHSKYGIALSLPAARQLLYSLSTTGSLQDTISAAALYRVHNLPAISEDLVSCSIFTSACFNNNNNKHSLHVANAFLPHLRSILERTEPLPVPSDPIDPVLAKSNKWLKWTLRSLQNDLARQVPEQDISWLETWRKRSGHVRNKKVRS